MGRDTMTQTKLFSQPKTEEIDPAKVKVIHDECNTEAKFDLFSGGNLPTYFCPKCNRRINCKPILSGLPGWTVII